jgi:2',3'-cyclic-nucleotide 2'-phosphodiesterase (5'-nucleotidase family)
LSNLQARIQQAEFGVLTANVTQRENNEPLAKTFVIESAGPVKVAFFGLTWIRPLPLQPLPLTLSDPIVTARKLVPELRRQADVVVAVTHIGLAQDGRLAAAVEGVDLILGGHTHSVLPKGQWVAAPSGRKVLICQAGDYLRRMGVVDMMLARKDGQWQITEQTARLIALDDKIKPDESIAQIINTLTKDQEGKGAKSPEAEK